MTATSDTLRDRLRPAAAKLGWRSLLSLRWLRLSLMFALPVAIVIGGTLWYLMSGRYVSTDDAYVQADTVAVSSDVAGRVIGIDVARQPACEGRPGAVPARSSAPSRRRGAGRGAARQRAAPGRGAARQLPPASSRAGRGARHARLPAARIRPPAGAARRRGHLAVAIRSGAQSARHGAPAGRQRAAADRRRAGEPRRRSEHRRPNEHPLVQQAQAQLDQAELDLSYTVVARAGRRHRDQGRAAAGRQLSQRRRRRCSRWSQTDRPGSRPTSRRPSSPI